MDSNILNRATKNNPVVIKKAVSIKNNRFATSDSEGNLFLKKTAMVPQITKFRQYHTSETVVTNRKYPSPEKYSGPKLIQMSKKTNTGAKSIITRLSKPLYRGRCIFIIFPIQIKACFNLTIHWLNKDTYQLRKVVYKTYLILVSVTKKISYPSRSTV